MSKIVKVKAHKRKGKVVKGHNRVNKKEGKVLPLKNRIPQKSGIGRESSNDPYHKEVHELLKKDDLVWDNQGDVGSEEFHARSKRHRELKKLMGARKYKEAVNAYEDKHYN